MILGPHTHDCGKLSGKIQWRDTIWVIRVYHSQKSKHGVSSYRWCTRTRIFCQYWQDVIVDGKQKAFRFTWPRLPPPKYNHRPIAQHLRHIKTYNDYYYYYYCTHCSGRVHIQYNMNLCVCVLYNITTRWHYTLIDLLIKKYKNDDQRKQYSQDKCQIKKNLTITPEVTKNICNNKIHLLKSFCAQFKKTMLVHERSVGT